MNPTLTRPLPVVAAWLERPHRTLRTWVQRGELGAACDVRTRQLVVDMAEALALDEARATRREHAAA